MFSYKNQNQILGAEERGKDIDGSDCYSSSDYPCIERVKTKRLFKKIKVRKSMITYVVGFLFSILLIYYAEGKKFSGKGTIGVVWIALLIPCLIAGLRDHTIGTDVRIYAEPLFQTAQVADSFLEYWKSGYSLNTWDYTAVNSFEVAFAVVAYVSAKVFHSMPIFLCVIQALTIVPIYKGLRAFSRTQPVWLGMAVYYLMFFNQTLNMMRQWIAMAFLFYGFQYLKSNNSWKYFLWLLIGMLFHVTAVIGVAVFVVYQLVAKENTYNRAIKAFLLVIIGCVAILGLPFIVRIMESLGLRYTNYISGDIKLMPNQFLYRIPILLILIWRWKYLRKTDSLANFYLIMIVYDVLASQLVSIFEQSGRIGLFFGEYYLLAYPAICMASDSKHNRRIMRIFVLCYLCIYWWYLYVYGGAGETVPYVSIFG